MTGADQILFGADSTEGIVAVEPIDRHVRVYRRAGEAVVTEDCPFRRWLLAAEQHSFAGAQWTQLEGSGFNWLAEFDNPAEYQAARYRLRDAHADHIAYPGIARQYLTRSGRTFFKGLSFDDVVRMQIDIETLSLNPDPPENEIILIGVTDNRGFETAISGTEPEMLHKLAAIVRERDPDIIEGHNIHAFDLPYLAARAARHAVKLALGRDGSEPRFGPRLNCTIGYFSRPCNPVHISGRQVIDTLLAVQRFDVGKGVLSSHGLKAVARTLGIAEDDRELIPPDQIASEWQTNPDRVTKYCLQDVRETRSLAALVCPPDFYLAQMAPDSYERSAIAGTGEKINYIFIRDYLRRGRAIPRQSQPRPLPGGHTEVCRTGVIERVVKCDVESLYPSIMLTQQVKPEDDTLGIFLPALRELTARRIAAKRKAKETSGREHAFWDGLQSSFKILINSFYGYLGGPFNFNDFSAAAQVTTTGRQVVKDIVAQLQASGGSVIEVDTDGVYFQPPAGIDTEEHEIEYVERIGASLPEGIHLAHDGRYKAMLSLKIKNYILWGYDGSRVFRGSSLRSRAEEPFGTEFISAAADTLVRGDKQGVRELYEQTARQIETGKMPLNKFARRERITEKTFSSPGKRRLAEAVGDANVGDYVTIYQRSDGSIALADNYNHDEDRDYLLDRLYRFALRLKEGFGGDFDTLIPKPSIRSRIEAAGQQTLDLFD